jgi:hypothetical protein
MLRALGRQLQVHRAACLPAWLGLAWLAMAVVSWATVCYCCRLVVSAVAAELSGMLGCLAMHCPDCSQHLGARELQTLALAVAAWQVRGELGATPFA